MLRLYQFEISPFCDKIRRTLHLKGLAYEIVEVPLLDFMRGRMKRLAPANKLPVLEVDGRHVADSTEIAAWLDEHYPLPPLYPAERRERALTHVLEDWADESLYFYEMHLRLGVPTNARRWVPRLVRHDGALLRTLAPRVVPRAIRRVTEAQGVGRKDGRTLERDLARHAQAVDALVADSEWLVGSHVTIADIAVFAMFDCLGSVPEGQRAIAPYPAIGRWMERVRKATVSTE
jgi:glutathione S-transferase